MRRLPQLATLVFGVGILAACADPVQPDPMLSPDAQRLAASEDACWGQATKVFARLGEMGEHASQQPTPRVGLANLARALYEAGVIDEPTMQALGAFVAAELGLDIDACM
ncbi:MAG: hypothetical protein GWM90_06510 [Gemmatimonadetes bacterium]|nr:hypothetical protein [Gemmatimonadota bacterium]NIQ53444.1 hypothetical protein [Gemmatimonadota bacterium]NIU73588.1 hypothetical protein [Gammaproteobacteria bacterium]NIX43773.1 hypothetical protein [Gemmatimonadota bacterium]NIY07976.1 hypothetical protein [Gemmatimonadota bacterium]